MSTSYSPTPPALRVEIKPSNYFRIVLVGVTLAALAAIFYAALAWPLRLLLVLFTVVYAAHCWRTQMRQCGVLQWRSVWFWCGTDGAERAIYLQRSTVWPGLIVLTFLDIKRPDIGRAEKFVLTLLPDSFSCDDARRLRVHLNHFPVFVADDAVD